METRTHTRKASQARGHLMRLEHDLGRANWSLRSATRNRIVGGVMLLIAMLALIARLATGNQFFLAVVVVGLSIGGWMFVRSLAKIAHERRSIGAITDRVTNAQANLAELVAQSSAAE